MREVKETWLQIAEDMTGSGDLDSSHPALFLELYRLDQLVKRAKPDGELRSSQVIATVVAKYHGE